MLLSVLKDTLSLLKGTVKLVSRISSKFVSDTGPRGLETLVNRLDRNDPHDLQGVFSLQMLAV